MSRRHIRKNHCPSPDDVRAAGYYARGALPPAGERLGPLCSPWKTNYVCAAQNVTCETCKSMLHAQAQLLNLILAAGGAVEDFQRSAPAPEPPDPRQIKLL